MRGGGPPVRGPSRATFLAMPLNLLAPLLMRFLPRSAALLLVWSC
jgi:hypothetical protein